jgi:hypothetical protein
MRDFTKGHRAWGVTSLFNCLSTGVFFFTVFLIVLTADLNSGFPVSCHSFRSPFSCFNKRSKPGRPWFFMCESVTLHGDSINDGFIGAVKLGAVLSAFSSELTSILGGIKSWGRLWNRSESEFSNWFNWSSIWYTVGRWSESCISETTTLDNLLLWWITISSMLPSNEWRVYCWGNVFNGRYLATVVRPGLALWASSHYVTIYRSI